jgi:hypothetical protein
MKSFIEWDRGWTCNVVLGVGRGSRPNRRQRWSPRPCLASQQHRNLISIPSSAIGATPPATSSPKSKNRRMKSTMDLQSGRGRRTQLRRSGREGDGEGTRKFEEGKSKHKIFFSRPVVRTAALSRAVWKGPEHRPYSGRGAIHRTVNGWRRSWEGMVGMRVLLRLCDACFPGDVDGLAAGLDALLY